MCATLSCVFNNNITDIPQHTCEKIVYFFSHYKDLEKKAVTVGKILGRDEALTVYRESVVRFNLLVNRSTSSFANHLVVNSDGYSL